MKVTIGRHRGLAIACGALLTLIGLYAAFGNDAATMDEAAEIVTVARRDIVTTVRAVGEVTYGSEQELRFNQRGTVGAVRVEEGDAVQHEDILAELDKTTILADVRQSQLALGASNLQLQQLLADRDRQLLEAQHAVREAERQVIQAGNDLTIARQELPNDVATAERAVREKRDVLAQVEAEFDEARVTTLQSLAATAQDTLTQSEDLLDTLHGILVNDAVPRGEYDTKSLTIYGRLSNDPLEMQQAEWHYYDAINAVAGMRARYGASLLALRDPDALATALREGRTMASVVHALAESVYRLLQKAIDDPRDFTVADIQEFKEDAIAARTDSAELMDVAEAAIASLTDRRGLESIAISEKEDAIVAARNALATAEENLRVLTTRTPADIEKQRAAVLNLTEDYAAKEATLSSTTKSVDIQIALKRNEIAQRAVALQKARKAVEDYQIVAPFDGIIRTVDYKVGDNLFAETGEEKFVVIENRDALVVTIPLDQIDVVQVRRGMPATIVFDAVPERAFTGAIADINPTPIEEAGVISYEVEVRLPTPADLTILSGMTATVTIETARAANVLSLPALALKTVDGQTTVQTPDGRTVTVTMGITDGRYTQILSGLAESEVVLSVNVRPLQAPAGFSQGPNPAQQFFRGMGGFGQPSQGGNVRRSAP